MPLLSLFPDAKPLTTAWPTVRETPITHLLPAPTPAMPAPQVEVTSEHHDPVSDTRQITLHLFGTSPQLRLSIPAKALVGWSASDYLVALPSTQSQYHVGFEGVPPPGVDIQLTLRQASTKSRSTCLASTVRRHRGPRLTPCAVASLIG